MMALISTLQPQESVRRLTLPEFNPDKEGLGVQRWIFVSKKSTKWRSTRGYYQQGPKSNYKRNYRRFRFRSESEMFSTSDNKRTKYYEQSTLKCFSCGKLGYRQTECRFKLKNYKLKSPVKSDVASTSERVDKPPSIKCFKCGALGHVASCCTTGIGTGGGSTSTIIQDERRVTLCVVECASGFHLIQCHEESIDRSVFITPDGQYEYLTMHFRLKNSITARTIANALGKLICYYVIVYVVS